MREKILLCIFLILYFYVSMFKCMCVCLCVTMHVSCSEAQLCYYHVRCQSFPSHMTCQVRIQLLSNTPTLPFCPSNNDCVGKWGVERGEWAEFIYRSHAKEGELRVVSKIKLAISPSLPRSLFYLHFTHSLFLADSFIDAVRRRV